MFLDESIRQRLARHEAACQVALALGHVPEVCDRLEYFSFRVHCLACGAGGEVDEYYRLDADPDGPQYTGLLFRSPCTDVRRKRDKARAAGRFVPFTLLERANELIEKYRTKPRA